MEIRSEKVLVQGDKLEYKELSDIQVWDKETKKRMTFGQLIDKAFNLKQAIKEIEDEAKWIMK